MIPRLTGDAALEFMDRPRLDAGELRDCLRDIGRLNRWFGGAAAVLSEVQRIVRARALNGRITVLDIGTGGGDIPRALLGWSARRGLAVEVVACDIHDQIIAAAAASSRDLGRMSFVRTEALALPFVAGHFDFVLSSLTLHHLPEREVVPFLRGLRELPRQALIVCDLERARLGYAGVWLATHAISRNRFTRHDGPVSVLRAYTLDELAELSREAGCGDMRWRRRRFFRVVGVLER